MFISTFLIVIPSCFLSSPPPSHPHRSLAANESYLFLHNLLVSAFHRLLSTFFILLCFSFVCFLSLLIIELNQAKSSPAVCGGGGWSIDFPNANARGIKREQKIRNEKLNSTLSLKVALIAFTSRRFLVKICFFVLSKGERA